MVGIFFMRNYEKIEREKERMNRKCQPVLVVIYRIHHHHHHHHHYHH